MIFGFQDEFFLLAPLSQFLETLMTSRNVCWNELTSCAISLSLSLCGITFIPMRYCWVVQMQEKIPFSRIPMASTVVVVTSHCTEFTVYGRVIIVFFSKEFLAFSSHTDWFHSCDTTLLDFNNIRKMTISEDVHTYSFKEYRRKVCL